VLQGFTHGTSHGGDSTLYPSDNHARQPVLPARLRELSATHCQLSVS
jgi:hypothetical protein